MLTNDLTPEQRKAVKCVREALKLVPETERRVITAALKELWLVTMTPMLADIERLLVWDEAVTLAYKERTGEKLQPGEAYTAKDAARAAAIMTMYPWE